MGPIESFPLPLIGLYGGVATAAPPCSFLRPVHHARASSPHERRFVYKAAGFGTPCSSSSSVYLILLVVSLSATVSFPTG